MSIKATIGCPTTDYVHKNFAASLSAMARRCPHPIAFAMSSGSSICQNRITCVNIARKNNAEFLLFIDNDMSFPHYTLERMIHVAEEKSLDILGCNYLFKVPPHHSMAVPLSDGPEDLTGIDEVRRLPTGLMLIRMSLFDKLEEPWFVYKPSIYKGLPTIQTEDYVFSDNARAAGFKVHMDSILSLEVVHWGSPLGVQWSPEPPGYRYLTDLPGYEVV